MSVLSQPSLKMQILLRSLCFLEDILYMFKSTCVFKTSFMAQHIAYEAVKIK